jgi:hypothetical protein
MFSGDVDDLCRIKAGQSAICEAGSESVKITARKWGTWMSSCYESEDKWGKTHVELRDKETHTEALKETRSVGISDGRD